MSREQDDSGVSPARDLPQRADRAQKVLETALESVGDAVLVVHAAGREIVGCNPAAGRLFGYESKELLGRSTEILHTDTESFELFGRLGEEVLCRGETFRTDWKMRRRDGSVFPSSHVVSLIDENLGLEGGAVSIVRDRSSIASVAAALHELEERYRVLFDDNPEPMCVYELGSGDLLAVNAALAELYGGSPEDLVGRRLQVLLHEADEERAREWIDDDSTAVRRGRWRARRLDGSVRVLRSKSSAVTFDGRPARLVVTADITEQLATETQANRLLAILDATPDFVGIADRDERVLYVNPAGLEMVGMEGIDVTATHIADYLTPESLRTMHREALPAVERAGVWSGETRLRHRDGREIPVSQVLILHQDEETGSQYLSTVARDLRKRQHLEEQLRQAQKMEAIGRLSGGIAHDFNNILTAILGYADLARLQRDRPQAVERHVAEIISAARRASELTTQLLAIGRRQTLDARVVDLDALVRETVTMLRRTIEETIDIRTDLSGGAARVRADRSQMQQVILNLVVNARDAMPAGGTLTIATDVARLPALPSTGEGQIPAGEYAVLRVSDTGTGIGDDVIGQIFEPFFTTKEPGLGTGLGLPTVYGVVRQSDGYVHVESEPGRGSTFTIHLPAAGDSEGEEPAPQPPVERADVPSATVLLAEDDPSVRHFLETTLRRAGHRVQAAGSADEAVELRHELGGPLDLLISDVLLPGMDGRELAARLRAEDPDLPVLLISGYSYDQDGDQPATDDAPLLRKPFSSEELLDAVGRCLSRHRD